MQDNQRRGTKRPSNSPTNKDSVEESNESCAVATTATTATMENQQKIENNLDEHVLIEVKDVSGNINEIIGDDDDDDDDVYCIDGPTTSKKQKIESLETPQTSNVCHINNAKNDMDMMVAPANPTTSQYLDEQSDMVLIMNKQQHQDYMVNTSSNSTSCSSSPPPPPLQSITATTISTVNSTCDSNLPYSIDMDNDDDNNDHTIIKEQHQQEETFTHLSPEVEQHHQSILNTSMQLDNCTNHHLQLHNTYNSNNNDNNLEADDEDDVIEQKFNDAENYVLESGEVSTDDSGNGEFLQLFAMTSLANFLRPFLL